MDSNCGAAEVVPTTHVLFWFFLQETGGTHENRTTQKLFFKTIVTLVKNLDY